jgi:hypothetical protein
VEKVGNNIVNIEFDKVENVKDPWLCGWVGGSTISATPAQCGQARD